MIEIVEDDGAGSMDTSSILQQLVDHYNQPIHLNDASTSRATPRATAHDDGALPSMLHHWLSNLNEKQQGHAQRMADWMQGYITHVRPVLTFDQPTTLPSSDHSSADDGETVDLVQTGLCGVAVLVHFELLLRHWVLSNESSMSASAATQTAMSTLLNVLATDITTASGRRRSMVYNNVNMASDVVIPALLRLLQRALRFASGDGPDQLPKQAIQRCFISLMAFGVNDSPTPASILTDEHLDFHVGRKKSMASMCLCPPHMDDGVRPEADAADTAMLNDVIGSCSKLSSLSWDHLKLDSSQSCNDAETGSSQLIMRDLLSQIDVMMQLEADDQQHDIGKSQQNSPLEQPNKNQEAMQQIISKFDAVQLAQAIRAHFFGRDMSMIQEAAATQETRMILGRTVTRPQRSIIDDKPCKTIPSRVHVVATYIRCMSMSLYAYDTPNDNDSLKRILESLLPVFYQLVDSTAATHIALGTCGILRILQCMRPSALNGWLEFADTCFSVLDRAAKVADDASVKALLGRTLCELFLVMRHCDARQQQKWKQRRRQMTHAWFLSLEYTSSKTKLKELLIGGIIPLLHQHGQLSSTADAMELGGVGLTTLLPLVKGNCMDVSTRLAATIALINLFVGAYPAMPYHGRKLMLTLLTTGAEIKRTQSRSQMTTTNEGKALHNMILHAASITLRICELPNGKNRAKDVLEVVGSMQANSSSRNAMFETLDDILARQPSFSITIDDD